MSQSEDDLRSGSAGVGPTDERPLTEKEFQQVQRFLGDPFSFPISYKTWLISYLESSDLSLPISAVNGLTAILGIAGLGGGTLGILPAGLIFPFGADAAPAGSLLCDGAAYLRTNQPRLFGVIGSRYGAPDASSFNVPDLRERIPAGKGTLPAHDTVGKTEGQPLGSRGVRHYHDQRRVGWETAGITAGTDGQVVEGSIEAGEVAVHDHKTGAESGPEGGPAFITLNFIIVA